MEGLRILLYHSVGDVDPRDNLGIRIDKENFLHQMKFLKENNYNVCRLTDAVDYIKRKSPIPNKTVAISFDDGYKDNALFALPIMEKFGFGAVFFVTVDYIGRVKTSPHRDWQHWECMGWDDLKDLIDRGYDIGSHSLHHIDLSKLDKEAREKELKLSKEMIESSLKEDIEFFSYPYGYFDEELLNIVKNVGYRAACTTTPGINTFTADLYKLKRTEIVNRDRLDSFRDKLEGQI